MTTHQLPSGYSVIRIQDEPDQQRRVQLMDQVRSLLAKNYGSYAENEHPAQWLKNLEKSGADEAQGMKMMVSVVMNAQGKAVGFSSVEVLPNGQHRYALNGYTAGEVTKSVDQSAKKLMPDDPENYPSILYAAKKDAAHSVNELTAKLKKSGVFLQGNFQEHKTDSADHRPKILVGFALGQAPLGAIGFDTYQIPVYGADVKGENGEIDAALFEETKKEGTKAELFFANFMPGDPTMPMAQILTEFAQAYVTEHSAYARHNDDPGYRAMIGFAKTLSHDLTYRQAYEKAALGAATYLNISPASV